jgi:hypothetical protein
MIWEIGDSFLVILPLSFAFLFGSFATLRVSHRVSKNEAWTLLTSQQVWLAVQKTLTTVKTCVQKENSVNRDASNMRMCAYLIAISMAVALGYLAIGVASFDWIARGLFLFLSVPIFFVVCVLLVRYVSTCSLLHSPPPSSSAFRSLFTTFRMEVRPFMNSCPGHLSWI